MRPKRWTRRIVWLLLVTSAIVGVSAAAAAPAAHATHGARRAGARRARAVPPRRAAPDTTAGARLGSARTLEDIHIEGEAAVPQVLFITARDQRRFMDFELRRYLATSRELAASTKFPSHVTWVGAPTDQPKEITR